MFTAINSNLATQNMSWLMAYYWPTKLLLWIVISYNFKTLYKICLTRKKYPQILKHLHHYHKELLKCCHQWKHVPTIHFFCVKLLEVRLNNDVMCLFKIQNFFSFITENHELVSGLQYVAMKQKTDHNTEGCQYFPDASCDFPISTQLMEAGIISLI